MVMVACIAIWLLAQQRRFVPLPGKETKRTHQEMRYSNVTGSRNVEFIKRLPVSGSVDLRFMKLALTAASTVHRDCLAK